MSLHLYDRHDSTEKKIWGGWKYEEKYLPKCLLYNLTAQQK